MGKRILLLTAVNLAILAVWGTSAALATEFEAGAYPASISGKNSLSHVFTPEGGVSASCKGASFSGELAAMAETVTVAPSYSECTAFGLAATVSVNGCAYVLHPGEESGKDEFKATMDISCPAGKTMTITAGTCEVQVATQKGLGTVTLADKIGEESTSVGMEAKLTEVHYVVTKDGFLCPLSGTGEKTKGSYSGDATLSGLQGATVVGFAAVQNKVTKLCKKNPKAVLECEAKQAYGPGTEIEATAEAPAQPEALLKIYTEKPPTLENIVRCPIAKITAATKEEEGQPLKIESFSLTFEECKSEKPTKCQSVYMENGPAPALLYASVADPHNGFTAGVTILRLKCAGEIECKYQLNSFATQFLGANVATLKTIPQFMKRQGIGGEMGCFDLLAVEATYAVAKPQPVWVTR